MDRFPFSLSLYAIVSRECASKYLARALESFKKLNPDEIVLCSAMGSKTDEGFPILEEVGKKFNAKVVRYDNSEEFGESEYLDNFAKARNTALDACTKDWCMWFDADDLLIEGAERAFFEIAKIVTDHDCIYAG
jgi:glycosyltransferase involved in cell wall biosynthesis